MITTDLALTQAQVRLSQQVRDLLEALFPSNYMQPNPNAVKQVSAAFCDVLLDPSDWSSGNYTASLLLALIFTHHTLLQFLIHIYILLCIVLALPLIGCRHCLTLSVRLTVYRNVWQCMAVGLTVCASASHSVWLCLTVAVSQWSRIRPKCESKG